MKKYFIFLFLFSTFLYANENYISLNYISQSDNFDFQFVLAESENMIDFKVSKILDLENVITGKYDFSLIGEKIRYYEKVILFDGKEYEIEKVKIELWSEDDLYNETRGTGSRGLTFEDFFAEENDYIKVISIDVAGNYNLFGTYLFVVNENTIITEYSGVYYLLEPVCSQEDLIKINPKDFSDNTANTNEFVFNTYYIPIEINAEIKAIDDGSVINYGYDKELGLFIQILYENLGIQIQYCNLKSFSYFENNKVKKNEKIAISGITGKTDGQTIRLNIGISKLLLNLEN